MSGWRFQGDRLLDAGEQGCGVLVLNVADHIAGLQAGQVLEVHAYDPLAHLDLECWCHMAGHSLLAAEVGVRPQRFFIRKENAHGEASGSNYNG